MYSKTVDLEKMTVVMHNLRNSQSSHEFLNSTNNVSYISNLFYLRTRTQLQNYVELNASIVVKNELGTLSRDAFAVCVGSEAFYEGLS